jgi:hypothetical protein
VFNSGAGRDPLRCSRALLALALIVAHQHCAGLELAPGRAAVACQTVQEAAAFPIEAAKGPFLQAASNHSP